MNLSYLLFTPSSLLTGAFLFVGNFCVISCMKHLWLILFLSLSAIWGQDRQLVEGEYLYKFSDQESIMEAKELCYNMALRNALESYSLFINSMTKVQDFQLRNDIIQSISSGYLNDLEVVEERIDKYNNEVYYKLKAYIEPLVFKDAIKKVVERRTNLIRSDAITSNTYFSIIGERTYPLEGIDRYLAVIYQKREKPEVIIEDTGEKFNPDKYLIDKGWKFESTVNCISKSYIMITWYDSQGSPLDGSRKKADCYLNLGEIRNIRFEIPGDAKSWDIRLQQ